MTKVADLQAIADQIIEKNICSDLAAQATQLVFGDGNPDAEIVFIGEAPGKNEDIQGKPFVGAAGKFLDEMLGLIHLGRKDIYITNIVKYRPLNNRDPLPEEKKIFLPYLYQQLETIKPKLVVPLGRHSASCFLPDIKISRDHGVAKHIKIRLNQQSSSIMNLVLLPLYHPAAALYNGSMRQILIDDFMRIPIILEKLEQY